MELGDVLQKAYLTQINTTFIIITIRTSLYYYGIKGITKCTLEGITVARL